MTQDALTRRRGQRKRNRSNSKVIAILGGCALLLFGITFGVIFGLLASTSPSDTKNAGGAVNVVKNGARNLVHDAGGYLRRKKKGAGGSAAEGGNMEVNHLVVNNNIYSGGGNGGGNNPVVETTVSIVKEDGKPILTKKKFLKHVMKNANGGGAGPFPYYPADGSMHVPENYDFNTNFTPQGGRRFEEYMHGDSPYGYKDGESDELARSRRYHVKKAMEHAWAGYEKYAFGEDELAPKSHRGNSQWGGMGTTLVDSLDTLWLMNMKDEFYRARDWCKTKLRHNINKQVSVFETTIRSLGGLLSAYDWSGDDLFLEEAKDLGSRLFKAFDGVESGIPNGQVNLETGRSSNIGWSMNSAILSEFTTLQIEYRYLARLSGIKEYKTKTEHVFEIMDEMDPPNGLYPYFIRNNKGKTPSFANQKLTFGAMSDSFYEYMLKIWIQGGKTEPLYRKMYDKAIQGMHDELLSVSTPSGLVFIADKNSGTMDTKMDHLVCFMGGLLALGAYTDPEGLDSQRAQRDLKTAKALTYTCYQMYARMPTGISPEYIQFHENADFESGRGAPHYLLRPETVESFFVLYHLTKDPVYREWGWEVFSAIEKYCKTDAGYGQLKDVRRVGRPPEDKMESFFLAETLKYLYLLFDPDTPIDLLNKHVFNTEAHPVRIFPKMDQDGVIDLLKS